MDTRSGLFVSSHGENQFILSATNIREWQRLDEDSIVIARMPKGRSVFLVEDETLVRMMVADMLEELGCHVVAEAGRIDEAIKLVRSTEFDLAILDVNVCGEMIFPVAKAVKARNRPIIFATGYGSLPEEFQQYPRLQKPFQLEVLGKMIDETLKGTRPGE